MPIALWGRALHDIVFFRDNSSLPPAVSESDFYTPKVGVPVRGGDQLVKRRLLLRIIYA